MEESFESCDLDMGKLTLRIEMTIPCQVEAIDPVLERIMENVGSMPGLRDHDDAIELALREALANAIVHGCKGDPRQRVAFCVASDETQMLIIVRDPGPGFDPTKIPSPLRGQNLYSSAGRGIFLINQFMDEVHFEKGGTEIHMIKKGKKKRG